MTELIKALREQAHFIDQRFMLPNIVQTMQVAADLLEQQAAEIANLRNFACQLCGRYKMAHMGSCSGCRWEKKYVD